MRGLFEGTVYSEGANHSRKYGILNIPSQYQQVVINEMPAHPVCFVMDSPPTLEELLPALGHLKAGKAGGRTGIMPELLKYGRAELQDRLLKLMQDMWGQGSVVGDWRDTVVVPTYPQER